jgi:hypothetical protein
MRLPVLWVAALLLCFGMSYLTFELIALQAKIHALAGYQLERIDPARVEICKLGTPGCLPKK